MATWKDVIKSSLRKIQAIPKGGFEPDPGELSDAFAEVQNMHDELAAEGLGINSVTQESVTLTASDNSYSIGTGGDLNTTRPQKILQAWIRSNNYDYPIEIISREDYSLIPDKTTTGRPYYLAYEESYPLGRVDLYPSPDAAYTLYLESRKAFTKPTAVTDTFNLPEEYKQYFVNNLAVRLGPEYGTEAPQSVQALAMKAERILKVKHASPVPRLYTDPIGSAQSTYDAYGDC